MAETVLKDAGDVQALSRDGSHAIVYNGREGNVSETLYELGRGPVRVLLDSALRRGHQSYAEVPNLFGGFSPDGKWLATATSTFVTGTKFAWDASVELQTLDGKRTVYRDRFRVREGGGTFYGPGPVWAPGGAARFAYWRDQQDKRAELVVVDFDGTAARAVTFVPPADRLDGYLLSNLLWSPDGAYVAWADKDYHATLYDVRSGTATVLKQLPEDVSRWRWASSAMN